MGLHLRYKPNAPKIAYDTFDDEVVLINLESGNYYSLNRTAARVWAAVERCATVKDIVEELRRECECSGAAVEPEVLRFVTELHQEGLIVSDDVDVPPAAAPAPHGAVRIPFEPPVLQKFTDMADLLLLDPIHEVDEYGWPHQTPAPPGN
jgi:hypothetical protein